MAYQGGMNSNTGWQNQQYQQGSQYSNQGYGNQYPYNGQQYNNNQMQFPNSNQFNQGDYQYQVGPGPSQNNQPQSTRSVSPELGSYGGNSGHNNLKGDLNDGFSNYGNRSMARRSMFGQSDDYKSRKNADRGNRPSSPPAWRGSGYPNRKRTRAERRAAARSTNGAKRRKDASNINSKEEGGSIKEEGSSSSSLRLNITFSDATDLLSMADVTYLNDMLGQAMIDDTFPENPPSTYGIILMKSGIIRINCKDETSVTTLKKWVAQLPPRPDAPSGYTVLGPQNKPKERVFTVWIPSPGLRHNLEKILVVLARQNPDVPVNDIRIVSVVGKDTDHGFHMRVAVKVSALPSLSKVNFRLSFLFGQILFNGDQRVEAEKGNNEVPELETNLNTKDVPAETG